MEKKLLFHGDGNDAQKHIDDCKIKGCKTCQTLKEFLKRLHEEDADEENHEVKNE